MRRTVLLALFTGLLAGADAPEDAAKKDLKKLQGKWSVVKHEHDGKAVPTDKDAHVEIKGNKFTTRSGGKVIRQGSLKLDPTKDPKEVDATYTLGPLKGKTVEGIYELDGDTWKLCYADPGTERPRAIPEKAGKGQHLLILKRDEE